MIPSFRRLAAILTLAVAASITSPAARADDNMFPPSPAAKPFIDFDGRGFMINGQRTFITSGSLHYPRVPHEQWRDILLRMKRAGFNTVQTYIFWNFHEPQEGKWNFEGDHDLDAFLKLIHSLGMYATVRVGPYVCAEWDSGGYPVWLRFKEGLQLRQPNAPFEAAVDRYFEKVIPIVAANQINRGGSVIFVQLENEHPKGWGREMPNEYFHHLQNKALSLGLEVPYWFSGLHHSNDPAGGNPWDSKNRTTPWYTSEFWPGWYSDYGPFNPSDFRKFTRGTWKILAYGGNGYNYYMLFGGTNFSTWNNDETASSYDYSAAIGQTGDLRPIYYKFKKAAMFARSMQSVLDDCQNATEEFKDAATASGLRVTARRGTTGAIAFLDNDGKEDVKTQFKTANSTAVPSERPMTIAAGEIMPIVTDYALTPEVKLDYCAARILGIVNEGNHTTLVVYGPYDDPLELAFSTGSQPSEIAKDNIGSKLIHDPHKEGRLILTERYGGWPTYSFSVGPRTVHVLILKADEADNTWFIDTEKKKYIICGPDYVADVEEKNGKLQLYTEARAVKRDKVVKLEHQIYTSDGRHLPMASGPYDWWDDFIAPTIGEWQSLREDAEIQPAIDTAAWKSSAQPQQMGADGDISAYAWYRANFTAPAAGTYSLRFSNAADWLEAFVNGQPVGASKAHGRASIKISANAGENQLTVFTAHMGREKLFSYLGPIDKIAAKGLSSPVTLAAVNAAEPGTPVTDWVYKEGGRGEKDAKEMAAPTLKTDSDWKPATIGQDIFNGRKGFAWYRTTLTAGSPKSALHFECVDDNATVYLNGKKLAHHEGWDDAFDVPLADAWHATGPNVVAVLVENIDGAGGITKPVELQTAVPGTEITHWKMRGGIAAINTDTPPTDSAKWQPFATPTEPSGSAAGWPTWYRTAFTAAPPKATGPHPIYRVTLHGMSRGFAWLNGHNLGRYPEKVPVDGLYLPESWLVDGKNALAIFDEDGKAPTDVHLVVEQAASRTVTKIQVPLK